VEALNAGADPSVEVDIERVLLVTVTERRTKDEIDHYVKSLQEVLSR
jgi:antitoxin component of MazEF toxin-antitoxin module